MKSVHSYLPADPWGEILHNESVVRAHRRAISVQQQQKHFTKNNKLSSSHSSLFENDGQRHGLSATYLDPVLRDGR